MFRACTRRLATALALLISAGLAGCWEDELEVVVNADGTGTVKHTLTWTERYVAATTEGELPFKAMPLDKYGVTRLIGDAMKISDIRLLDLPGGGKRLYVEGTFDSPSKFFLSEYCRDFCRLRLAQAGPDTAALTCDLSFDSQSVPFDNISQLYGVAKGLRVLRTIHLPAAPGHTNGLQDPADPDSVRWVLDLRDLDGLRSARTFMEGRAMGVGFASMPASTFSFPLPLVPQSSADSPSGEAPKTLATADLKAEITSLAWHKVKPVGNNVVTVGEPELSVGIRVSWPDGLTPVLCDNPVLTGAYDDQGNDLVQSSQNNKPQKIFGSSSEKRLEVTAKAPAPEAKKLKKLSGYVRVVADQPKQRILVENLPSLAGLQTTGIAALDAVHFKVLAVSDRTLRISLDRGYERIASIALTKADGQLVHRRSGSGKDDWYVFEFGEPITPAEKLDLELILDEKVLFATFIAEDLELP